ncbi:MAG: nucleotidyl transferase AbiEii/AbiGii toxin family protein [Clostridia bacterium]|nr:nucleotidyl transferase AbiEii/AbiGii toxin family protein [Clostridia bacterium]
MSLKAKIRNIAKTKNIPAQVILQNYMFERFLNRLSASEYKERFVLKGGMLVAALVGLDNRATMDLDTTLKNLPLTPETIEKALNDIFTIDLNDEVTFSLKGISPIREDDIYGGYRVALDAVYETIVTPMTIDVSTGDVITPNAVKYDFTGIFDDELTFEVWAYNIETVLAEKVETILRRSVFNTRPRDFYDAYILITTQSFDKAVFAEALEKTIEHRGTRNQINDLDSTMEVISESADLQRMWSNYQSQFSYAKGISFEDTCNTIKVLLSKIK